jgi:hypothetical protein
MTMYWQQPAAALRVVGYRNDVMDPASSIACIPAKKSVNFVHNAENGVDAPHLESVSAAGGDLAYQKLLDPASEPILLRWLAG